MFHDRAQIQVQAGRGGDGTGIGRDDTIFATRPGTVAFKQSGERRFVEVND